ncbi:diguanylate cyclase (GGDEF) domain-containing protein [Nitrosomonas sp. Nm51]|uniref:GGDEF domain-containing protein n=1 Tax=Nitrosomonas sp. Nm51 TaxID=133720 RepID=UPI0008CFA2A9|nr:GGDEF domain-containing protein [Nitrosomonas sp. Nm51]SER20636.1 diguanylate cyclase (GGDEF) domain-containing protein [Nitrosomonas sp. Nm51]
MAEYSSKIDVQKKEKIPSLLDKLASLTTIRDIELFELSLLKTMAELLKIKQISMYKLSQDYSRCGLIVYSMPSSEDGLKQCLSESRTIDATEIETPEEIRSVLNRVDKTRKPFINDQNECYSIIYPVKSEQKIESLLSFELPHSLTNSEVLVISSLLAIADNFRKLLDENQKDKLTGLLNRHTFEQSIDKIQALSLNFDTNGLLKQVDEDKRKAQEELEKYCLAIIDIDNFKQINDRFGHIIGDEVLLLLSYIMKQNFRAKDLLFRFGGEEFVVIYRVQCKEEAQTVLERFRKVTEDYRFPQVNSVTISIGATYIDKNSLLAAEIIGNADKALYFAKNNGKNQTHFYEDLIQCGHLVEHEETGTVDFF